MNTEELRAETNRLAVEQKLDARDTVLLCIDVANDNGIDLVPIIPLDRNGEEDHRKYELEEKRVAVRVIAGGEI